MTSVSTHDIAFTRAHTATYLTEVILGTIGDILAHLGITASPFTRDWDTNEAAINAWIAEGSLDQVVLECHQPSGTVDPVIEFPVKYTAGRHGRRGVHRLPRPPRPVPGQARPGSGRHDLPAVLHLQRSAHPAARLGPRHPGWHQRAAQHHVRHARPRPARLGRHALPPPLRTRPWAISTTPSAT